MGWRTVSHGAAPRSEGAGIVAFRTRSEKLLRRSPPSQKNPKNCSADVRFPVPAPEPCGGQKPSSAAKYGGRDGSQLEGPNEEYRAHNPKVVGSNHAPHRV